MEINPLFINLIILIKLIQLSRSLTNEELVERNIIKWDGTKCPDCYASQWNIPICGSDGLTYQNPGTLTCAFKCNQRLRFVSYGPCPENDPAEDLNRKT